MANDIFFEINGTRYSGFTQVTLSKSLESFASFFTATLVSKEVTENLSRESLSPVKLQDDVAIYIDEQLAFTGSVEDLQISYDEGSHKITISGRDKVFVLIDSSVQPKNYKGIGTLQSLIEKVLSDNGFNDFKVISQADNIDNLEDDEDVKAETNDTIFSFLDRYAKKVQVLLTTDEEGNIVLTREGVLEAETDLISIKAGEQNNIKRASIDLTTRDRFRFVEVYALDNNDTFTKTSISQVGIAEDKDIISNKRLKLVYSTASKSPILQESAKWQVNVRRAKGLRYSCVVANFKQQNELGNIWQINKLVNINDDKCQLNNQFLISGIVFNKSLQGSTTEITVVNKGSFTSDPFVNVKNDLGSPFITSE